MPIKVACRCGQSFAANDNLAGRTVKCPKCGNALQVPAPAAPLAPAPMVGGIGSLLEEEGITAHTGIRCPKCEQPLANNAVLCTRCGFHLQTGQAVATTVRQGPKAAGHGEAADSIMQRAAAELEKAPPPREVSTTGHLAGYLMAFGLLITAVAVIAVAWYGFNKIESSGNSQYYAGIVMLVVGSLMAITGHVALLIFNFKEGIIHGVLSLIIPFYAPVYGALRNQGFWAFLWLLGNVFVGLGFGMTVWFKGGNADPGAVWLTPATKSELTAFAPASILRAEPHT